MPRSNQPRWKPRWEKFPKIGKNWAPVEKQSPRWNKVVDIRNPVENKTNFLKPRGVAHILWIPQPKPMMPKYRNKFGDGKFQKIACGAILFQHLKHSTLLCCFCCISDHFQNFSHYLFSSCVNPKNWIVLKVLKIIFFMIYTLCWYSRFNKRNRMGIVCKREKIVVSFVSKGWKSK